MNKFVWSEHNPDKLINLNRVNYSEQLEFNDNGKLYFYILFHFGNGQYTRWDFPTKKKETWYLINY